ncbi:MAG: DNA (cytosine-5-)-methyltransferase [Candidatus Melainabacteria bacterium]|nr:DNA (cytosine-5-)-methyltransferase [Candidatus Melainabacteria bacterium]
MTAKQSSPIRALEFYSGIGAFAQAAQAHDIEIVAAFDQSQWANQVYAQNYKQKPVSRNLDSISIKDIPEADLWWLSPPCTPYSRRGEQKDTADPRAKSFLHLIEFMVRKKPPVILLENVEGFLNSKMAEHLRQTLHRIDYQVEVIRLCPTMFGVPMLRPRIYFIATRVDRAFSPLLPPPQPTTRMSISQFVDSSLNYSPAGKDLLLNAADASKYEPVLNVVDLRDINDVANYLICFTSGYFRCRKASGSLLRLDNGRLRFFSPKEILSLLRFSPEFSLSDLELPICYRLVGNSVDVRAIDYLLSSVLQNNFSILAKLE